MILTFIDHKNIIGYCSRPFNNIEEMNEHIVNNWNKTIRPDDIVYVLGDFCFSNKSDLINICNKLNGHKILILGNHDRLSKAAYYEAGFETVSKCPMIIDGEFILSHQPVLGDIGKFYNIHGHKHKLPNEPQVSNRHFDIGVDDNSFFPHRLDNVINTLKKGQKKKSITIKRKSIPKRLLDWLYYSL